MSLDREGLLDQVPLTGMRDLIARRMVQSLQEAAQLTLHRNVSAEGIVAFRESFDEEVRPSVNDILLAAVARVLIQHPTVNATLEDNKISRWRAVHLGVAVAVDDGLVVPVIRNADRLSLAELRAEAARLGDLAHEGGLTIPDLLGGTFTVSNLGGFGIDLFTPILNPPQVAILGVGRIQGASMGLSLTIDHRAVDGVPGGNFLRDLAELLESPEELR